MWVVHIQFDTEEKVANLLGSWSPTVDVALHLVGLYGPRNTDFIHVFVASGRLILVTIVKPKRDSGFADASIATFVDQVLHFFSSDGWHARDSHDKANCIEDIWLAWTVQACNRVELGVKILDICPHWVGLEAVKNNLFYVHSCLEYSDLMLVQMS